MNIKPRSSKHWKKQGSNLQKSSTGEHFPEIELFTIMAENLNIAKPVMSAIIDSNMNNVDFYLDGGFLWKKIHTQGITTIIRIIT